MVLVGPLMATQGVVLVVVKVALEEFVPNKQVAEGAQLLLVLELRVLRVLGRAARAA
jgi:hypothetical protein